jgi:glycosyltransferase involved in cell wall biosynthesis
MSISLIIPAYNASRFLAETVASVRAQSYSDWELIVVNDGSSDDTLDIACSFAAADSRIRVVDQAQMGLSGARNAGLRNTNPATEFIIFLDSDDLLESDAIFLLVDAVRRDPSAVAAHGNARYIDARSQPLSEPSLPPLTGQRSYLANGAITDLAPVCPTNFDSLALHNWITTPGTVIIRRNEMAKAGEFDGGLSPCEDWEMWLRLARSGHFAFVNQVVLAYRRHGANMSGNLRRMYLGGVKVRSKVAKSPEYSEEQRQIVRTCGRYLERVGMRDNLDMLASSARSGRLMESGRHLRHAIQSWYRSMAQ